MPVQRLRRAACNIHVVFCTVWLAILRRSLSASSAIPPRRLQNLYGVLHMLARNTEAQSKCQFSESAAALAIFLWLPVDFAQPY